VLDADGAADCGRLTGRRMGSATVSAPELLETAPNGAAQFPQKRLAGGFSVAQVGHRVIGCSVAIGELRFRRHQC